MKEWLSQQPGKDGLTSSQQPEDPDWPWPPNLLNHFFCCCLQKSIATSARFSISSHVSQIERVHSWSSCLTFILRIYWQQIKLETCQLGYYQLCSGNISYFPTIHPVSHCQTHTYTIPNQGRRFVLFPCCI